MVLPVLAFNPIFSTDNLSPLIYPVSPPPITSSDCPLSPSPTSPLDYPLSPPPSKRRKLDENYPQTPEKWYDLQANPKKNGRVEVLLTPEAKRAERVIYIFKNIMTGKVLIGMTGQKLSKRVSQYQTQFNKHAKRVYQTFYEEVQANPSHFKFGILYRLKEGEALGVIERTYLLFEKFLNCYNQNRGGGGCAVTVVQSPLPSIILDTATIQKFKENIPNKSYPIKRPFIKKYFKLGRLQVTVSPNGGRKRGVVYGITDGKRWIVGKTEQEVRQRMYGYNHLFAHSDHELAQDVRERPQDFRLYILHENSWGTELSVMERIFIQVLDAVRSGYNSNDGGGGGSAQSTARRNLNTIFDEMENQEQVSDQPEADDLDEVDEFVANWDAFLNGEIEFPFASFVEAEAF